MRYLLLLTPLLFAYPVHADMRSTWSQQEKLTNERNSCEHYDAAQWQEWRSFSRDVVPASLGSGRVLIRPNGTLFATRLDLFYEIEQMRGRPLGRSFKPRTCSGGGNLWSAKKMGTHTHFHDDGSGSKNQTVVEGDFLVTYSQSCIRWACGGHVTRHVLGVRIGSPTYKAASGKKTY